MHDATNKILVLGGTKEAAELEIELKNKGFNYIISFAGRTAKLSAVAGSIRVGGFGGINGLIEFIKSEKIVAIIDATHPFAEQITANVQYAALETKVPLAHFIRMSWKRHPDDYWEEIDTIQEACIKIPPYSNAFLAIGSQYLRKFFQRSDIHFTIRMIDPPKKLPIFAGYNLIFGKPSPSVNEEKKLFIKYDIKHLVCRNSGGDGGYAKIAAARQLGINVIMIRKPTLKTKFPCLLNINEVFSWLLKIFVNKKY